MADLAQEVVQEAQRERIAGLAVDDAGELRREPGGRGGVARGQAGLALRAAALDDAQARADAGERAADERDRAADEQV